MSGAVAARMRLKRPQVCHASEMENFCDLSARSRCDCTAFEVRVGAGGGSQCYEELLICLMLSTGENAPPTVSREGG